MNVQKLEPQTMTVKYEQFHVLSSTEKLHVDCGAQKNKCTDVSINWLARKETNGHPILLLEGKH